MNCLPILLLVALAACDSKAAQTYKLPIPKTDGNTSVEKALANRRSHRNFQNKAISIDQLSQILWAAYGTTSPNGLRTAPSAGALYPLEIYAIIGNVEKIEPGVYKYIPEEHKIVRTINKDVRAELRKAALGQEMIEKAPVSVFYSAIFSKITDRYGERGSERYVHMGLGHSAQNIYLQAEALQLGTCAIGAFTDSKVKQVLQLPAEEEPLYIMPVGYY
ncbi:MAG: SagB/ThcOx family dehydrogenase [Fibromonadaceae bacterium]|nr:SagB/ThcOx family dehydrogenase [Fibromonadaceae bacterium]